LNLEAFGNEEEKDAIPSDINDVRGPATSEERR
jgi:hypothetical protein